MAEDMIRLDASGTVTTAGEFNAQAAVTFTLVGTNLVALYRKAGTNNTFLVIPTDKTPSGGMTIKKMVEDINALLGGYDPEGVKLKAEDVAGAVQNVDEASRKQAAASENMEIAAPESEVSNIDYESITVELRQAFLYLNTGEPIEYAFELDVDTSQLFDPNITFFNVKKLSIGVWNTNRESILERMNIIDFDTYLGTN